MRKPTLQDSYIVRFFAFLTHWVYHTVSAGYLGKIFTSYSATDRFFRTSYVGRFARTAEHGGRVRRAVRRNIALAMNKSVLLNGVLRFLRRLCRCSLRTIGLFLVTMGSYSALMYWLFSVIWRNSSVNTLSLFGGLVALILGVLLLFSDVSLGYALYKGAFFGKLLVEWFGVSDDSIKEIGRVGSNDYAVAIPLGMVLGTVGALTSPFYLLVGLLAFLLFLMVLSVPEAGVILLILFVPFAGLLPKSELWMLLAVALPLVAYLGKLLRGKRAFHMEVQDLPALLLLVLFLLSGFSLAGGGAWQRALLSALLVAAYFLVVNVIKTPQWMHRCRAALIISATAASLFGIFQFIFSALSIGGATLPMLGATVTVGFADHTTLAYFLVVAFPFTLSAFISGKKKYRLPTGFAMVAVVAATVLTWVPVALIAILIMLIVFLLLYERRSFPFVLLGGVVTPITLAFLPDTARARMLSMLRADVGDAIVRNTTGGSLASRIFFEGGSGIFSGGAGFSRFMFGLGTGGIEQFCALYTPVHPEVVARSFNFWLYLLLENGIFGIILPAVFFFLLYQNCFSLMRSMSRAESVFSAITGIMMVTGVLILGMFDYAWHDPAALVIFFVAAALIAADARYARERSAVLPEEHMRSGITAELDYYGEVG